MKGQVGEHRKARSEDARPLFGPKMVAQVVDKALTRVVDVKIPRVVEP